MLVNLTPNWDKIERRKSVAKDNGFESKTKNLLIGWWRLVSN